MKTKSSRCFFGNRRFQRRILTARVVAYNVLIMFLLPVVMRPLSAQQIVDSGDVSPSAMPSPWSIGEVLYVGNTADGELSIQNGGQVSNTGSHIGYGLDSTGMVIVDGDDSIWTNGSTLNVGNSGSGELIIRNNGQVVAMNAVIGLNATGAGTVTVDGAAFTNNGLLHIGRDGSGELTILNGGQVSDTTGMIGYGATGTGTVTVDGDGSTWTNSDSLWVGNTGTGTLNIQNGGLVVSNGTSAIGADRTGTVTVDGNGSTWTNDSNLYVGFYGSGELVIQNGGLVSNTNGAIGLYSTSTGTVTVDGAGSEWNNSNALYVGGFNGGAGTLNIQNGGLVNSTNGYIGYTSGGRLTNTATVDGDGSEWNNSDTLHVGHDGSGELAIMNSGQVNSTNSHIGYNATGTGTATVDGAGSTWANSDVLSVGYSGTGELAIQNGGLVNSANGYVGYNAGSTGTVTVDGAGSEWNNSDTLSFGHSGTAGLTISRSAEVTVDGGVFIAEQAGGSGVINIGAAAGETPAAPGALNTPTASFGSGTGKIVFNHTDTSGNYMFAPVVSGGSAMTSSVDVYSGATVMTGVGSDYFGRTTIYGGGILAAGAAGVFSPNSSYAVQNLGMMDLRGHNQTVGSLTNAGLVNMGTGAAPGTSLTVRGDYVGQGGTIAMNTRLEDDFSPSDRLIIDGGSAAGNTFLQINNAGGLGAETKDNGILVVNTVNGGATSIDAFELSNQVTAGAFTYGLYRGGIGADAGSENWYLRSAGLSPSVPPATVVPVLALRAGRLMLGTFYNRANGYYSSHGDYETTPANSQSDRQNEPGQSNGNPYTKLVWGRVFGEAGRVDGGRGNNNLSLDRNESAYSFNSIGGQMGADILSSKKDTLGAYAGASGTQSTVKNTAGNFAGRVDMDLFSLGGYWTHRQTREWYTDLVVQGDWYRNINSQATNQQIFNTNGHGLTISAETGYAIKINEGTGKQNGNRAGENLGGMSLIQEAQFVYQHASIQGGNDHYGQIRYDSTKAFYARLGNRLSKTWTTGTSMWAEVSFWNQLGRDARTTFSDLGGNNPTILSSPLGSTWVQLLLGASTPLKRHVNVFCAADYNAGLSGRQSSKSVGGVLGVQIGW